METQVINPDAFSNYKNIPQAYLLPFSGTRIQGQAIQVQDFFCIGRDSINTLILKDPQVSARHARIERRGQSFFVRDLNSRNGSFINNVRVNEAPLCIGDQLRFGESIFAFSETQQHPCTGLKSRNPAWNDTLNKLPAFAVTEFPVQISGPSGAGKDIIAQTLHQLSPRRHAPFVSINCSNLSDTLIESELFGHTRGSFTGATGDRKGAFESARGGTLFLDEIADLPLSLQPKLLRALENHEIRPLGSDHAIKTDVRIISASHKNLFEEVLLKNFREDLFYRLHVCPVYVPALKERMEDFETLLYLFAKKYKVRFSFDAIEALKRYSWPGNIRELQNLVARASALYPQIYILPEHLGALLDHPLKSLTPQNTVTSGQTLVDKLKGIAQHKNNPSIIKEFEREIITACLIANNGHQRQTAVELGIPKSTLHDRIHQYQIDIKTLRPNRNKNVKV